MSTSPGCIRGMWDGVLNLHPNRSTIFEGRNESRSRPQLKIKITIQGRGVVGLLLGFLILLGSRAGFAADAAGGDDLVLKALQEELQRSKSIQLEDLGTPYFMQYAVDDTVTYQIAATYGAIVSSEEMRSRTLQTQVRVGSYELDNSNFTGRGGGGRRGLSGSTELPTDDDYMAIRYALWLATDAQYKEAVEGLTQKRAYMKDRNIADRAPDFTKVDPVKVIKERVSLKFDRAVWEDYARRISASFGEQRHIQSSDLSLTAGVENRYLVNSEGSQLRYGDRGVMLRVTAEAVAEDGERLSDHLAYYGESPDQLPPIAEVLVDVKKLADRLTAATKAPVLEDYTGPVLMDELAAPQLFRQLLVRGIAGQPEPVGSQRRGADDLENRLGKRILPATFHLYDDPREDKFRDTFLVGHYEFDDEGIPAQRVEIVVDGKLDGMVMSRAPTKQFGKSNGHGRRAGNEAPHAAVGCLYVESAKGESRDELKKELIDAAEAEGLKYGLRITAIQGRAGGGSGFGGGRFRRGPAGGGAVRTIGDPISIYKVYVADGHEEPVRGCEFNAVDVRALRKIIAAGNSPTVHNNFGGAAPASSVIAPAVLFEELELTRIKQEAEKKPIIEAPQARKEGK